jgi:hypothetical protein
MQHMDALAVQSRGGDQALHRFERNLIVADFGMTRPITLARQRSAFIEARFVLCMKGASTPNVPQNAI